ncbi:hypothetical protein [Algoriphagus sp. Y33]|nr:hypothetical protein [Algoriphagus sp. Y33]
MSKSGIFVYKSDQEERFVSKVPELPLLKAQRRRDEIPEPKYKLPYA